MKNGYIQVFTPDGKAVKFDDIKNILYNSYGLVEAYHGSITSNGGKDTVVVYGLPWIALLHEYIEEDGE